MQLYVHKLVTICTCGTVGTDARPWHSHQWGPEHIPLTFFSCKLPPMHPLGVRPLVQCQVQGIGCLSVGGMHLDSCRCRVTSALVAMTSLRCPNPALHND